MKTGDVVTIRHQGRVYLAEITEVTSRTAHVRFTTSVPPIDNRRRRERVFSLSRFVEGFLPGAAYHIRGKP